MFFSNGQRKNKPKKTPCCVPFVNTASRYSLDLNEKKIKQKEKTIIQCENNSHEICCSAICKHWLFRVIFCSNFIYCIFFIVIICGWFKATRGSCFKNLRVVYLGGFVQFLGSMEPLRLEADDDLSQMSYMSAK